MNMRRLTRPCSASTRCCKFIAMTRLLTSPVPDVSHPLLQGASAAPFPARAMATSSIEVEHLRGVAAHHLLLILVWQGPKQCGQGCLSFEPDRTEVRKIGSPESLIHSYARDGVVGSRITNEPVIDPCPHVVAGAHGKPGEMETGDVFVDLVQAGHKPRDPRHLILATDNVQVWKACQYPPKDEVIGEHRLNLREELDPFRRIGTALFGRLLLSASQGREDLAREEVQGHRRSRCTGSGPEPIINGIPVGCTICRGLTVNHGIP